jgi:hypothetical protein
VARSERHPDAALSARRTTALQRALEARAKFGKERDGTAGGVDGDERGVRGREACS